MTPSNQVVISSKALRRNFQLASPKSVLIFSGINSAMRSSASSGLNLNLKVSFAGAGAADLAPALAGAAAPGFLAAAAGGAAPGAGFFTGALPASLGGSLGASSPGDSSPGLGLAATFFFGDVSIRK
jgi:hypothetical protein